MNETTAVAVREVKALLDKAAPEFSRALPAHVPPERFRRVAETAILNNPDLFGANRRSLMTACIKAAQDGLYPDGRDAALVVFKGQVQYMPMIAGILKKARNSGDLASISAHVVYERDEFDYALGDDERITHRPHLGGARGKPIAAYAIARTKDGAVYREVMSVEEVEQVRRVSRAGNSGPWATWWGEMARKTVLRRLSKRLPMSTDRDEDLHRTIRRDDDWQGPKVDLPAAEVEPPPETRLDAIEDAIEVEAVPAEDDFLDAPPADPEPIENATPADLMAMTDTRKNR